MSVLFLFIFTLGVCIGSFLNVLIDRLPNEQTLSGRSHCDYCKKILRPLDLIPILSYLFLRAKTACCHKKLSVQYPAIELLTGVLFIVTYILFPVISIQLVLYWIIVSCLIVIFFADYKYHIIPDTMLVVLTFTGILLNFSKGIVTENLLAGVLVMMPMLALYLVTKGKGIGFGDVKFAFPMGLLLGLKGGFLALYLGFMIGGVYGIILLIFTQTKMKTQIPFGPFLIIGLIVSAIQGQSILNYLYRFF